MATRQSSPPCDPLGLLLLLLVVFSTHLPEVHTRPIDFWCRNSTTNTMNVTCSGSDALVSPVKICVAVRAKEWASKTLQQKKAEVMASLQVFLDGVQDAMRNASQSQHPCLEGLKGNAKLYLNRVKGIVLQNEDQTQSNSAVQLCNEYTNLNNVLVNYKKLIDGKLNRFKKDIKMDGVCPDR